MRLRYQIMAIFIAAVTLPVTILGYSHWIVLVSIWLASAAAVALVMLDEVHPHDPTSLAAGPLGMIDTAAGSKSIRNG